MQWGKGFGAEEARAAIERAGELAAAAPGQAEYWPIAYSRFAGSLLRGEFQGASEIADAYLKQAEAEGRLDHAIAAHRMLGTINFELGAFAASRQHFETMLAGWDDDRDSALLAVLGSDVKCAGQAYMAILLLIVGEVDAALRMSQSAIGRAEALGDFRSYAFAVGLSLPLLALCGHAQALLPRAEAFEALASEKAAGLWLSNAKGWAIWARGLLKGDPAAAAAQYRSLIDEKLARRERQSMQVWFLSLAQLLGAAGMVDQALGAIANGLALAEATSNHCMDAGLHGARGDLLAAADPAAAEAAYARAIEIARAQGARTFELQSALALARLLQTNNRPLEAHDVLAPALAGFAPTPELPAFAEAEALLAALTPAGGAA